MCVVHYKAGRQVYMLYTLWRYDHMFITTYTYWPVYLRASASGNSLGQLLITHLWPSWYVFNVHEKAVILLHFALPLICSGNGSARRTSLSPLGVSNFNIHCKRQTTWMLSSAGMQLKC